MIVASLLIQLTLASGTQGSIIAPGTKLEKLGGGLEFGEGPATDKAGNVYFTDQPNDRIMKWSIDGKLTQWMRPAGRSNGIAFDTKGNLITCADEKNELWSISPSKKATVLVKDFGGKLLNGPNDLWIRPDGALYFTDPRYPRPYWKRDPASQQDGHNVYFLSKDRKTLRVVVKGLKNPNGIVGTRDGKKLYVSDIDAGETFSFTIRPNGDLEQKTPFCKLGSDGMTLDDEGNVYLTGRGVTVFDKSGKQIEHIDVPEGWTGNVKFGGADRKLLFITASKSIYGLRMRVKGIQ